MTNRTAQIANPPQGRLRAGWKALVPFRSHWRLSFGDVLGLFFDRLGVWRVVVLELLAVAGIAVGVGLLFASRVAGTSLAGSVQRLSSEVVGSAQFQLDARGAAGVGAGLLEAAARVPGVVRAFPLLEAQSVVSGPGGREESVDLIGVDPQFARFGGKLNRFSPAQLASREMVALPAPVAEAINVGALETVGVQVGARVIPVPLATALSSREVGALADSPIALLPMRYAQRLTGLEGRLSRVFVQAGRGDERKVAVGLAQLTRRWDVNLVPADNDLRLYRLAESPENQSETLFSAISAIVGFVFALDAMLLTAPRRRAFLDDARGQGLNSLMALQVLLFDALVIGVLACALGIALGDGLSILVFHSRPGYLSFAFPVGNERLVTWQSVGVAVLAGMLAAIVGVLWPMRDVFWPARERKPRRWLTVGRVLTVLACLTATTTIVLLAPGRSELASFTLIVALLCALPWIFDSAARAFGWLQERLPGLSPDLTATHLPSPRTRVLSLAIVITSAIALYGVVAIEGAQSNLEHGLDASARGIDSATSIWVTPRGEANAFATTSFTDPSGYHAISKLLGVHAINIYRGSFMNWKQRRLWVLAPPATSNKPVPPGQLLTGNINRVEHQIKAGGWAVLSQAAADENHLKVGQAFTLPTPQPTTLKIAALSTNLGWPPGALILNANDYARAWGTQAPSAWQIQTQPGSTLAAVQNEIRHALGQNSGLAVETSTERAARHERLAHQGLARLTQIKLLVLIAAGLAILGALGSLMWQRRAFITEGRESGFPKRALWTWLVLESAILLLIGGVTGTIVGIFGQILLSHALQSVTGFPTGLAIQPTIAITTLATVTLTALTLTAIIGYRLVRDPQQDPRPA
jgi:putative ABC transport system permease protein